MGSGLHVFILIDTVRIQNFLEQLERTVPHPALDLNEQFLRAGVMENQLFAATREGVPQGGPLSPLLSNVLLNELDKELAEDLRTIRELDLHSLAPIASCTRSPRTQKGTRDLAHETARRLDLRDAAGTPVSLFFS